MNVLTKQSRFAVLAFALLALGLTGGTCQQGGGGTICGNGVVETGEQCDDGNTTSGDGCNSTCQNEATGSVCGNGVLDTGEQCDDGNLVNTDGCTNGCKTCGNGTCDPGETVASCPAECHCGDGICNTGETNAQCPGDCPPILFIANFTGSTVTSYEDPVTVNGNISPDTNLAGANTGLLSPSDIVVTGNGSLIASNFATPSLTRYDDAINTNGNLLPNGNVFGGATALAQPTTLAVSASQDLVFVANIATDVITVYENASGSSFNGNLPPIRTIATTTSGDLNNPFGINFGAGDTLYVANNGGSNVLVFAGASSLNGDVTPTRTISSVEFDSIFDVFVDGADNLFVVDSADDEIYIFNNASTLNGSPPINFTLRVPIAGTLTAIAVDSNDTGYIVDNTLNAVYSYNNISTRNGAVAPNRTIAGANTQFNGPIRVFLMER